MLPSVLTAESPRIPSLSEDHCAVSTFSGTSISSVVASNETTEPKGPAVPSIGETISQLGAVFGGPTVMMTDSA